MKKEQFLDLANKYAEGTATAEEILAVENYLNSLQQSEKTIPNSFLQKKRNRIWKKIQKSTHKTSTSKQKIWSSLYKAAALLVVMLGITYVYQTHFLKENFITHATVRGEKKQIILTDGSIVVLNSNSSVVVPEKFGNQRMVRLKGEAYFKVTRNPSKPFIINTKDVKVQVLGTSFNINAYNHNHTKVSVLTGKVKVSAPNGENVVLIKNNQVDFIPANGFVLTKENSKEGIAWTTNCIVLKKNSLAQTARILENWYDVTIQFQDKTIEELTISGKFKEPKLDNILQSIALLKELQIEYITPKQIIIRRKPN
ncbi:FecR family protein [Flavobacterium agrisoli]|uniref:FecR domain-containing protein n=1 Tax=Flavobacterium agrisoli TaxID=2793066 RepID=A0A934PKV3_9FLAO|nr:FecR domain-containing protein [Flavobacterium agrisoli]MBK0369189.1 FecR domain-containing protein [Flavobacterium agrisoli]